jgi:hypothetical protein
LSYLDPAAGDVELNWTAGSTDEIEAARAAFTAMKGKGFMAYKVTPGRRGGEPHREQIREFDPQAGRIVMTPPLAGG